MAFPLPVAEETATHVSEEFTGQGYSGRRSLVARGHDASGTSRGRLARTAREKTIVVARG